MVTNPATRDWTVTASLFATLNEMFGNRTICGIGRGDSRGAGHQRRADDAGHAAGVDPRDPGAGQRPGGRLQGLDPALPVGRPQRARGVGGRVRAEGARPHRRGGRRVHPAARRPRHHRLDRSRPCGRRPRRPAGIPTRSRSAWPRRPTSADDVGHAARPVPLVRRHGRQPRGRHRRPLRRRRGGGARRPHRLHRGPAGLRLQRARPGRQHPRRLRARRRSSTASASSARSTPTSPGCRSSQALGVDQFAVYLQHDAKEATLPAYGNT